MEQTWEVFDPRIGTPIVTTPSEETAQAIAAEFGWDYALEGEGW